MNKEKMTSEEIAEFNSNVEFNQSAASWVMDIICSIIFWPMIIVAIRRRIKYSEKIEIYNQDTLVDEDRGQKSELLYNNKTCMIWH